MNITLARANGVLSSRTRASTQVAAPFWQPMSVGVICEDLVAFPIYRNLANSPLVTATDTLSQAERAYCRYSAQWKTSYSKTRMGDELTSWRC